MSKKFKKCIAYTSLIFYLFKSRETVFLSDLQKMKVIVWMANT